LGKTYQGIVWTWSEEEDLAAIATTVRIPTVSWQTERPAPEWWLATGTFTKGYGVNFEISKIAIVNEKDFTMLTSKPITLGSSGVAFTRAGTFLGIVTNSKSPGLGIVRILGRPLMCQSSNGTKSVIVCKDFRENQWKQGVSNSDGSTLSESSLKVYDAFKAFYNQAIINWESILSVQSKASKTLKLRFLKTPLGKEGDSIINDIKNIIPRIDDAISKSVSASDDQFLDKSSPLSIGSVYDQLFKEYESLSSRMSEFDEKYSGYSPGFLCKSGSTINFAVKFKCASGQKKVKVKEFTLIN
jgi:hypothetical protein